MRLLCQPLKPTRHAAFGIGEMPAVVPDERNGFSIRIILQSLHLRLHFTLDFRHQRMFRPHFTAAEAQIHARTSRQGMRRRIFAPAWEPERPRAGSCSVEKFRFIQRPEREKSCKRVTANKTAKLCAIPSFCLRLANSVDQLLQCAPSLARKIAEFIHIAHRPGGKIAVPVFDTAGIKRPC